MTFQNFTSFSVSNLFVASNSATLPGQVLHGRPAFARPTSLTSSTASELSRSMVSTASSLRRTSR